jgi:hypothetical protein
MLNLNSNLRKYLKLAILISSLVLIFGSVQMVSAIMNYNSRVIYDLNQDDMKLTLTDNQSYMLLIKNIPEEVYMTKLKLQGSELDKFISLGREGSNAEIVNSGKVLYELNVTNTVTNEEDDIILEYYENQDGRIIKTTEKNIEIEILSLGGIGD